MNVGMRQVKQSGRTRVMIVDPGWHVGLKLADCLATGGYHAVLVRDLESMLTEIGEIQPEAILLSPDSRDGEQPSLQTIQSLCPQASVLGLLEPLGDAPVIPTPPSDALEKRSNALGSQPVEEWLQARLGMPCMRVQ